MGAPDMAGWNLVTRFGLELAALIALGFAGWEFGTAGPRWILAISAPIAAAIAWTTFNVPGDPSRSGHAPVEVNGWTRLAVELFVLGGGAVCIWYVGQPAAAIGYTAVIVVQYATALDRVVWLVEQ